VAQTSAAPDQPFETIKSLELSSSTDSPGHGSEVWDGCSKRSEHRGSSETCGGGATHEHTAALLVLKDKEIVFSIGFGEVVTRDTPESCFAELADDDRLIQSVIRTVSITVDDGQFCSAPH